MCPFLLVSFKIQGKERESGSFCFQQLKKMSSVIEAEAEATARGLQVKICVRIWKRMTAGRES
jgi:hypothetical protein